MVYTIVVVYLHPEAVSLRYIYIMKENKKETYAEQAEAAPTAPEQTQQVEEGKPVETKNETITAVKGFRVAAVKAGIKKSGKLDLGLIVADKPCPTAAVFTTNKIASCTVDISREHVANGKAQAIFVNAGNANACTGKQGEKDALAICKQMADSLNIKAEDIIVTSTGIIGVFMPMDKVKAGINDAIANLSDSEATAKDLAKAIMTTDLVPKEAFRQVKIGKQLVKVAGICKGSGMIAPNMATMLSYIVTDADVSASVLKKIMKEVSGCTFNKVTVDNHVSTNDTAVLMASGAAGNAPIKKASDPNYKKLYKAVWEVADSLARQMAADGEGANCMISIYVNSAKTATEANKALRAISDSPLVRCAFNGADPNWGRITSAVGYSGAQFEVDKLTCKIAGTLVFKKGRPTKFDAAALSEKMKAKEWKVEVDLGAGKYSDFCYTCDLSKEYVTINADYHT